MKEYEFLTFDTIDSTNSEAKRLVHKGISSNFVISALEQTEGRGRNGKIWESRIGNLYMSILLDSTTFYDRQSDLSFVTAIALYESVLEVTNSEKTLDITIKWPNDILVNRSKISGILLESMKYNHRHYLIIGIGVNIDFAPSLCNKETIAISDFNIHNILPNDMLRIIMKHFAYYYNLWNIEGFSMIRQLWLDRAFIKGNVITVSDGLTKTSGTFYDIDENGALILKLSSGSLRLFSTGDVFFGSDNG